MIIRQCPYCVYRWSDDLMLGAFPTLALAEDFYDYLRTVYRSEHFEIMQLTVPLSH